MKTRVGFVSNSSSSSFVILGYKVDDEVKNNMTDDEKDECWCRNDIVTDGYSGTSWCGQVLSKVNSGDTLEDAEYTIEELQQMQIALMKKYGVEIDKIKLYMGTRGC